MIFLISHYTFLSMVSLMSLLMIFPKCDFEWRPRTAAFESSCNSPHYSQRTSLCPPPSPPALWLITTHATRISPASLSGSPTTAASSTIGYVKVWPQVQPEQPGNPGIWSILWCDQQGRHHRHHQCSQCHQCTIFVDGDGCFILNLVVSFHHTLTPNTDLSRRVFGEREACIRIDELYFQLVRMNPTEFRLAIPCPLFRSPWVSIMQLCSVIPYAWKSSS